MKKSDKREARKTTPAAAAVGRIPSGLFILTACHGKAATGMLASWVQQCSFEPLQISVAVHRDRKISTWLHDGAPFVVNILDTGQTDLLIHFGRGFALEEDAFRGVEIERPDGGPPVLQEALAYVACEAAGRFPAGDHDLLIGRVVGGKLLGDGQPMVHIRKSGLHY